MQFKDVPLGACPRIYLASAVEVAAQMKFSRRGERDTVLQEDHVYVRGAVKGARDQIPGEWRLTSERIDTLIGA